MINVGRGGVYDALSDCAFQCPLTSASKLRMTSSPADLLNVNIQIEGSSRLDGFANWMDDLPWLFLW